LLDPNEARAVEEHVNELRKGKDGKLLFFQKQSCQCTTRLTVNQSGKHGETPKLGERYCTASKDCQLFELAWVENWALEWMKVRAVRCLIG
jgi:hypothetical protein